MTTALIHANYLSQKDIEICLGYDLSSLSGQTGFGQIKKLHQTLQETYSSL